MDDKHSSEAGTPESITSVEIIAWGTVLAFGLLLAVCYLLPTLNSVLKWAGFFGQ